MIERKEQHFFHTIAGFVDVAFKLLKIAQKEIKHYIHIKIAAMFLLTLYEKNKTSKKLLTNPINHGII